MQNCQILSTPPFPAISQIRDPWEQLKTSCTAGLGNSLNMSQIWFRFSVTAAALLQDRM